MMAGAAPGPATNLLADDVLTRMQRSSRNGRPPRGRQRQVRVGRTRVNVRESGTGEGPPVLILTGIGCNVEHFAPFQDSLGGRRTIAFDAPGTGWSDRPKRPMAIRDYAATAAE